MQPSHEDRNVVTELRETFIKPSKAEFDIFIRPNRGLDLYAG